MSFSHGCTYKHQHGAGLVSILLIISVAIFLGLFTIKVAPHYLENWTVTKIATDLAANPQILKQPRSKVYKHLSQAYRTNNLWDLEAEDTIKLKKDAKKGYIVSVQYEKRANLFHNIDLVTSFDKTTNAPL